MGAKSLIEGMMKPYHKSVNIGSREVETGKRAVHEVKEGTWLKQMVWTGVYNK